MGSSPVLLATLLSLTSLAFTISESQNAQWRRMPIWWDLHGNPWIYGPRWVALLFLPVLTLLVPLALYFATNNLEKHGSASKQSILNIVSMPALFLYSMQTFVILPVETTSHHKFPTRIFVVNFAIWVLIWFGYNVQYLEPNNVIGIISPWTSNASWDAVHSRAGLIFEISGILLFIAAFVVPIGWPMLVTLLVFWLGPWVISFSLTCCYNKSSSKKEPLLGGN